MGRTLKLLGRIISGLVTALLAVLLCCNLYLIGARALNKASQPTIFGYSAAVVVSGSMSGTIEVNDMVIFHRESSYAPDDIVTYKSGGSLVTHRIVEETEEGFITKGDANNTPDREPVPMENIVGKVALTIPKIGLLANFLRTPLGMLCLVLAGMLMVSFPVQAEKKGTGKYWRK